MNPTTSPTKKNPNIEIKDYCSALESAISVPIADPSKHSTLLLQKKLRNEIQPSSEENVNILPDETVLTEKVLTKMNSV